MAILLAALGLHAVQADPIVDIYENDGSPVYTENSAFWAYQVRNNSVSPPDKITYVRFLDVFASTSPTPSAVTGWTAVVMAGETPNRYDIAYTAINSLFYITAGASRSFGITTTRPDAETEIAVGDLVGIAGFQGYGPTPDTFQGPIGYVFDLSADSNGLALPPGAAEYLVTNRSANALEQIRLYAVASVGEPAFALPADWSATSAALGNDLWNSTILTNAAPLLQNASATFTLTVSAPPGWVAHFGTGYAQGLMSNGTLQPGGPGDDYPAPVGFVRASDANHDGAVDLADYAIFAGCVTGPLSAGPMPPACCQLDRDEDGDVDLQDLQAFELQFDP